MGHVTLNNVKYFYLHCYFLWCENSASIYGCTNHATLSVKCTLFTLLLSYILHTIYFYSCIILIVDTLGHFTIKPDNRGQEWKLLAKHTRSWWPNIMKNACPLDASPQHDCHRTILCTTAKPILHLFYIFCSQVVNYLLQKLELNDHRRKITDSYSCGTRRKLSTALALIGHPQILLLVRSTHIMSP